MLYRKDCWNWVHMYSVSSHTGGMSWTLQLKNNFDLEVTTSKASENKTTTHSWKPVFISSNVRGITDFAHSLIIWYLSQPYYYITWFYEASRVLVCEKNGMNSMHLYKLLSNVPEAKHAFLLKETHLNCTATLSYKISFRPPVVQSLA